MPLGVHALEDAFSGQVLRALVQKACDFDALACRGDTVTMQQVDDLGSRQREFLI